MFVIVHLHLEDGSLDQPEEGGYVAARPRQMVAGHQGQGQHHRQPHRPAIMSFRQISVINQ